MPRATHGRIIAVVVLSGMLLLAAACGGGSKKDGTATPTIKSGVTATSALKTTAAGSATASAQDLLRGRVTVLPGGRVVTADGTEVPADVATRISAGPTELGVAATPAPGTTPLPATAGPGATPPPQGAPTAPLCVDQPARAGCATTPPEPTATHPDVVGLALDSNPATPDLDVAGVTVGSGQNFTVGLIVPSAPGPYQGYDWTVIMTGPVAFVSDAPAQPGGLTICSATTQLAETSEFYGGCFSTGAETTFTGSLGTITFRCTGAGAGSVVLRKKTDPNSPGFESQLINKGGAPITEAVGPAIAVTCS